LVNKGTPNTGITFDNKNKVVGATCKDKSDRGISRKKFCLEKA
jgi:hypothetical protein